MSCRMTRLIVCFSLQLILSIVIYLDWRKDVKEIGKENLAVPLIERFIKSLIFLPFWLGGVLD